MYAHIQWVYIQTKKLHVKKYGMKGRKGSHWDKSGDIKKKGKRRRTVERGEGKSDSLFNIRLAGNVFLHSSVCIFQ